MNQQAVSDTNFGCWLLKCNPAVWDIDAVIRDRVEVSTWTVADNYRARMMAEGQPFLLWRTGRHDPGIVGRGTVTGPVYQVRGDDPRFADATYWIDKDYGRKTRYHCPIRLEFLRFPVAADDLRADPRLGTMEIFRQPFMANPLFLTDSEFAVVRQLLES